MSKKLFIIAAFSVALLASAEAFADGWEFGVLRFEDTNESWSQINVGQSRFGAWETTSNRPPIWGGAADLRDALKALRDDGWELVSVTASGRYTKMYFKKPKRTF